MTGWTTVEQKKIMLDYMKTHQQLAGNVKDPTFTVSQRNSQWHELMEILNRYGPERSVVCWRSVWQRIKSRNPFYEPMVIPVEKEKPMKRKYKPRSTGGKPQRASVRLKPNEAKTIAEAFLQEQKVSGRNARQYFKRNKLSAVCESTYPERGHQMITNGFVNPESTTELEENTSHHKVEQTGFLGPESTTGVEESAQVSSPHEETTGNSSIENHSLIKDAESSDLQQEERGCPSPQSNPVVEGSAAATSEQQKKRDKSATLACLRTITENVAKTQQSMTEAVWALVKVQEQRAKAEESMAESGKKFVDLLEKWLSKK